jgi:thioredoxin 1
MSVKTITVSNFEAAVLQADKPVLLDFWADWCGPCRMISPIIDELSESELKGKAVVGKVNVDEESELAQRFGVMSIPTLIVFKGGKPVNKSVGVKPREAIVQMVNNA